MKYLRTKDGSLHKVRESVDEKDVKELGLKVVKSAHSIETLCDELVIVWKDDENKPTTWHLTETVEHYLKAYYLGRKRMKAVYLGNWTEKGLVYVAKVNERDEVELL